MLLRSALAVLMGLLCCASAWPQDYDSAQGCTTAPPPMKGRGVFVRADCARFEGEFDGTELFGPGRVTFQDGREMEGYFVKSRLNGKGVAKWPDGRRYEGYFKNGRSFGFGEYVDSDGTEFKGKFFPGAKMIGWGTRRSRDGSTLIGEFRAGEPFGDMLLVKADGSREMVAFAFPAAAAPASSSAEQKPQESPAASIIKPLDDVNSAVRALRGIFGK